MQECHLLSKFNQTREIFKNLINWFYTINIAQPDYNTNHWKNLFENNGIVHSKILKIFFKYPPIVIFIIINSFT